MSYTPPSDSNFDLEPTKPVKVEKPNIPEFEFDPNRSDMEVARLIATDGGNDPQGGPIRFWSHSSLQQFGQCPYRLFLRRVKKIKEPSGEAAERGSLVHDECEDYVRGLRDEMPHGKKTAEFKTRFDLLRTLFNEGQVQLEENWGFDIDWNPLEDDGELYKNKALWCITKLDVFVRESETSALIIDHKTGKKWGNEVKHGAQALEYAISAFMKYPELEHVTAEFWYLDQGQDMRRQYTRDDVMTMLPRLTERAIKLTSATKFPAKPSDVACRWCHYRTSGDCEFGEAIG